MGMIKDNLKKEMEFENNEEIKVGLLIEDFINEFMNGKEEFTSRFKVISNQ